MKLEVVEMKTWQSKVLNGVAWVIGIRGKDVWCMTLTKGASKVFAEERKKERKKTYTGNAYCINCKVNVDFDGVVKTSDSGRRMAQGNCPICGTKVNRILGKA